MAERPALLRGARAAGAAPLAALALVLVTDAHAATLVARDATDPSASGGALVWQTPGAAGQLRANGSTQPLQGAHPALGDGRLAEIVPDGIRVTELLTGVQRTVPVTGADALAVSQRWLAWRLPGPDRLQVLDLANPAAAPQTVDQIAAPGSFSRPALDGDLLVYAVAHRRGSEIRSRDLATGTLQALRKRKRVLVDAPSVSGGMLLYVRSTGTSQSLRLGRATPQSMGSDRTLYRLAPTIRRDEGHQHGYSKQGRLGIDRRARPRRPAAWQLWSTALGDDVAYVTRLRRHGGSGAAIVSVRR